LIFAYYEKGNYADENEEQKEPEIKSKKKSLSINEQLKE